MPEMDEMPMLTLEQKRFFADQGYLVVPDVVTEALDAVKAEYHALMDGLWRGWVREGRVSADVTGFEERIIAAYRAGCEYFQPMDISLPTGAVAPDTPFHAGPAVFKMMTHPRLLDVVESLIGPEITSNPIQHVRIKPPAEDMRPDEARAHITATNWHQDRGVTQEVADRTDMITVWIAVTDATVENGCLQVLPGQHRIDLLPHCPLPQVGIPDAFIDTGRVEPLPVAAGGVVIFHPMTPHASLENVTDGIRWSFDLRYNTTGQPTGRAQFPDFIARSRAHPETELRDPVQWRTMWEDARAALSARPVTEFYRWDANAPYCA